MEFVATFQLDKMTVFSVRYSTIGNNARPDFATQAAKFVRSKRDYSRCGQCQEAVLPKGTLARKFYDKWNPKHLQALTDAEFIELMEDMDALKERYNHVYREADSFGRGGEGHEIRFGEIVELSKMEPKKAAKKTA